MAHVEMARVDLLGYAGLVGLAGALLAADDPPLWRLFGAWLAPTLGWLAAMYGGDYFDRELDAVAKPHRPIPSGRMSARTAFVCFVTCVALGAVVAVLLHPLNAVVVLATLAFGVSYSKYLKARGVWGNLVRGGVTAMAFVMGMLATHPSPPIALLPLALVFWLHDSGSNVVGTICDRDGDRAGGYQTVPVRWGDTAAMRLLLAFDLLWVAGAVVDPIVINRSTTIRLNLDGYFVLLAVTMLLGAGTVRVLHRAPRPIPRLAALRSHEILVVERLVLAGAFIAAARTVWLAVAVVVPAVAATMLTSLLLMRQVHEPTRPGRLTRSPSMLNHASQRRGSR